MEAFWSLAGPIVMALAAVGVVLAIKIARRREATRTGAFDGAVPARPLSAADARKMMRRYLIAALAIVGALLGAGVLVAA